MTPKGNKLTLANQLTVLRMCLVPALVILVIYGYFGWALAVFTVAEITDALDGLFARMRHERTQLGTILDPLATSFWWSRRSSYCRFPIPR